MPIACTSRAEKPAMPRSTMKAETARSLPLPVRANTTPRSACTPLEMYSLRPRRRQPPLAGSRSARVSTPLASEPTLGSVRPKKASVSPRISSGRKRSRCSALPRSAMIDSTRFEVLIMLRSEAQVPASWASSVP